MKTRMPRTIENMEMVMSNKRDYGFNDDQPTFGMKAGCGYCSELGMSFNAIAAVLNGYRTREEMHAAGYTDEQLAQMPRVKHHVTGDDRIMRYRSFWSGKTHEQERDERVAANKARMEKYRNN